MRSTIRITVSAAAAGLAVIAGLALGASPIAAASGVNPPKPMHINASGGDKTTVDADGTQGDFTNAVQGTIDSDGDQDARDLTKSEEATPQEKAPNKMSK